MENFDPLTQRLSKGLTRERTAQLMSEEYERRYPGQSNHYSADMILRMENDPDSMTRLDEKIWNAVFGNSISQDSDDKLVIPETKDNFEPLLRLADELNGFADYRNGFDQCLDAGTEEEVRLLSQRVRRKVKIKFIGHPDSGKTSLIAALIGEDGKHLPVGWTPETSCVCCIKSVADRPAWAGNDRVIVFNSVNVKTSEHESEKPKSIDELIDACSRGDEEFRSRCIVKSGGWDILADYTSHSRREELGIDDITDDADAIVAYSDASLLKNCDIVDLPGYNPHGTSKLGGEEEFDSNDSMLAVNEMRNADAIVIMCNAGNFLYGDNGDMAYTAITSLPTFTEKEDMKPMANLFVLASHAKNVPNNEDNDYTEDNKDLQKILQKGSHSLWERVKGHPSLMKAGYTESDFRARFFTSDITSNKLSQRFIADFCSFSEKLPVVQLKRSIDMVSGFFTGKHLAAKNELEALNNVSSSLTALDLNAHTHSSEKITEEANEILEFIEQLRNESISETKEVYNRVINKDHIVEIIEDKKYHKNKRDIGELLNDLSAELNNGVMGILNEKGAMFSERIDDFTEKTDSDFSKTFSGEFNFSFDAKRAFAGGVAGAAVLGALAIWAAACGNLGGYIIIAQVVGLLASIGIHVGGTAAAISAVSAIGGPVTIAIGLAVAAALTLFLALGGTWKRSIGNKIVKQYEKADALGTYLKSVNKFWDDTKEAFILGCDNIVKEWDETSEKIRTLIENKNNEREARIEFLKKSIEYLEYMGKTARFLMFL